MLMPPARRPRLLKLAIALVLILTISLVGTLAANPRLPAAIQSQSATTTQPQEKQPQHANSSATDTKQAVPVSPDSATSSKSPTIKADLKKAKQAEKQGLRAEQNGDWQAAYEAYVDAVNWAPHDTDYFAQREIAKSHVVQMKADLAERHAISGEIPAALRILREARELDPSNKVIRERLIELSALDPRHEKELVSAPELQHEMHLEHLPGKQNFKLRGNTQAAYEEIARRFGVEVAFDVELRSREVRLDADDLDFATVMRLLGEETHTFWRPLTKHLFFVADDTPAKAQRLRYFNCAHGPLFRNRNQRTDDRDVSPGPRRCGHHSQPA